MATNPGRRIDASSPLPPRVHTVFTRWSFKWTEPRSEDDLGSSYVQSAMLGIAPRREGAGWRGEAPGAPDPLLGRRKRPTERPLPMSMNKVTLTPCTT